MSQDPREKDPSPAVWQSCPQCGAYTGQLHRGRCAPGPDSDRRAFSPLRDEHGPTLTCAGEHCAWHNVDEPNPPGGGYISCPECWHLYPTARALRKAYRRQAFKIFWDDLWGGGPRLPGRDDPIWNDSPDGVRPPRFPRTRLVWAILRLPFVRASKITFCQYCVHDF